MMKDEEIRKKYFEYFEKEILPFIECRKCGHKFYYPRAICPKCGSKDLEIKESNGMGKIFAMTKIYDKKVIYGIIELDEGFKIYSNIIGDENEVDIGRRVKVTFVSVNGQKFPFFKLI